MDEKRLAEIEQRAYWGCHGMDRDQVLDAAYDFCRDDAPVLVAEVRRLQRLVETHQRGPEHLRGAANNPWSWD